MQYTCPKCGAIGGGANLAHYFCHVCPTYELMLPSDNGKIRESYLHLGEIRNDRKVQMARETYTFSRALHLMRYSGAKMQSEFWKDGHYAKVTGGAVIVVVGNTTTLLFIKSAEIMGSWVEVK